ncbi:MAG: DUF4175 family protein [Nitrospinae bacterium]|nr:DUF4175 family protein [Nitrospinota bacterium]
MAEQSFKKINEFLDSVIRARLKVRRLEAGMVLLLGVLAVLLLAPAAVVAQSIYGYSAITYAGLTILLLGVTLIRCWWLATRRPRRESIALDIEETHPDLGSNLISSLQLFPRKGELGDDDPTSPALIDALVNDTRREVEPLDPEAYVSHAGFQRLGRLAGVLTIAVLLMAFIWPGLYPRAGYLLANAADLMPSRITNLEIWAERTTVLPGMPMTFEVKTTGRETDAVELEVRQGAESGASIAMEKVAPRHFRSRWLAAGADARVTARTGRFRSRTIEVRVVAPPGVESIEVVQYPPEYTKLKPGKGKNGGHIRAYMGSEVQLAVKTNKPVQEALIALADGWRLPLNPSEEGDSLRGKMILGGAGSYQVRLKDAHGFSNLAPRRYQIDIIPDAFPVVMVTHPEKDLTVEADEQVTVKYRASDDFGLKSVYLEIRLGSGRPRRIKVWGGEAPQKDVLGRYEFDLRSMGIKPGGILSYRFIAPDVDTVSGPKFGTSKIYRIKIRDREAVIAGLDRNLGEISDELLDLLGDYLEKDLLPEEKAKGAKETGRLARKSGSIEAKATRILERIKRARAMLRPKNPRETLSDMDLSTLQRQLRDAISQYLKPLSQLSKLGKNAESERKRLNREIAARQEEATETLERLATMSEEIQRNVRVDRAGRTTESMIQRQRAIEQALEKMRRMGGDQEAINRVEKELEKLRTELGKLMQQMASLAQRMPAEFMNQRSMREMPMQDMMRAFERIREMMRQNNFQGALEQLRRLMSQLQRMRMALRGMQRQQMMSQRGGRPIRRQQSELAAIVEEQQAILGETVGVLENVVDRLKKKWPEEVAAASRNARAYWMKTSESAAKPLPPDCFPEAEPVKQAEPTEPEISMLGRPETKKKLSPREQAEKIQREKMRALSEFDTMLKKGEWGIIFQRLPEWAAKFEKSPCARPGQMAEKEKDAPEAAKLEKGLEPATPRDAREGIRPEPWAWQMDPDVKPAPEVAKGLEERGAAPLAGELPRRALGPAPGLIGPVPSPQGPSFEIPGSMASLALGGMGFGLAPPEPVSPEELAKSAGRLLDKSEKDAGGTEIAKLDGLRHRQDALRKRLEVFERHLRQMMQVYPFINPSIVRRITEAGEAMKRATAHLGERSSSRAVPPEEEAIRKLAQGQNSMQQAMQQMAQRGSLGMGTPRGFGALGPGRGGNRPWWSRNPNFPQPQGSNQRGREEDGNLGTQFSEVLIPDREQYKVPAKYREEIMEAMKDGLPSGMRGEIEDYFDRLTK